MAQYDDALEWIRNGKIDGEIIGLLPSMRSMEFLFMAPLFVKSALDAAYGIGAAMPIDMRMEIMEAWRIRLDAIALEKPSGWFPKREPRQSVSSDPVVKHKKRFVRDPKNPQKLIRI